MNNSWSKVENAIKREMSWLENVIQTYSDKSGSADTAGHPFCKDCSLRNIAILIVRGEIEAAEISKSCSDTSFWIPNSTVQSSHQSNICHGKEWHRQMMRKLEEHFTAGGCEVRLEPSLSWGRADLGVFRKDAYPLFVEVGTTSPFKLWMNLQSMQHFVYLIVPNDDKLIEFKKKCHA